MKKILNIFASAAFSVCFISAFVTNVSAIKAFVKSDVHDFTSDTETVYTASRAKEVLVSGASQWKLTDTGEAIKNGDGLTVPAGILSLYKSNPLTNKEDFQIEITYFSDGGDAEADGKTAFMYMSAESFGKSLYFDDELVALSVTENGDVYVFGEKINHLSEISKEDILTSKNPKIAAGDECLLSVKYESGKLSVNLSYNGIKRELVKNYGAEISGIRQMQLGGDKTSAKRIQNITYKSIAFYDYGEYVPSSSNVKAAVQSGEEIKEYTNAQTALNDVCKSTSPDVMLELFSDVTLKAPVKLAKNSGFTLDLNGYTVNRNTGGRMSSDGYVFFLDENSSLAVIDSSPTRKNYFSGIPGGVITGGAGDGVGGGFQLAKGSKLTMDGGSVVNCVTNDHGGAIRVKGSGVGINLKNVGFYCNMTCDSTDNCHGGAIYEDYEDCVICADFCIFEGNYSEDNGGAVYVNNGKFIASYCIFTENKCKDDGGAVYIESGAYATLDNCRFLRNGADGAGGAVYCNSSEGTRLSGEFKKNSAKKSGGAIYVCGDSVSISDAEIMQNTSGANGSGVYVDEMYDVSVQGFLLIRDNYNSKNLRDNLYLDDFGLTEAKIWCGGLDEGSEVWVRTGDSEHTVCENVSEYQKKYFWQDDFSKSFEFTSDSSKTENLQLVTSAVGSGNLIIIFLGIALMLILGAALAFAGRRKKKEESDNEK